MRNKKWIMSASVLILLIIASTSMGNLTITNRYVRSDSSVLEIDGDSGWINAVNITLSGDVDAGNDVNVAGALDVTGDIDSSSDINAGNNLNCVNDLDVTDDADVGGNLVVVGSCTANNFIGDGSALTGIATGGGGTNDTPSCTEIINSNNNSWAVSETNFKTAMTDLGASGGNVWTPNDNITVMTGEIEIPSNVHVICANTIFFEEDGDNYANGMFMCSDTNNWSITGAIFDGNNAGGTDDHGIVMINCDDWRIEDCTFRHMSRGGIYIHDGSGEDSCDGGMILNCRFFDLPNLQAIAGWGNDMIIDNIYSRGQGTTTVIDLICENSYFSNIVIVDAYRGIKTTSHTYMSHFRDIDISLRTGSDFGFRFGGGGYADIDGLNIDGGAVQVSFQSGTLNPRHISLTNFRLINGTGATASIHIEASNLHNISITDGEIINFVNGRGIYVDTARDIRIRGVTIIQNDVDVNDDGILLLSCDNFSISDCNIKGKRIGIKIDSCKNFMIHHNFIMLCNLDGIDIDNTIDGLVCEFFIISNNVISGCSGLSIDIDADAHTQYIISDNFFGGNSDDDGTGTKSVTDNLATWI